MAFGWDEEADVVVVGYGGAGASTAIAAHDAGAKVLVIEKNEGGGNTKLATLTYISPENSRQAKEHILALSFGGIDEEIVDAYLAWTSKNNDYIRGLGGEFEIAPPGATFPSLPGAETMIRYRVKASHGELGGESLWNLLSQNVERRKIPVIRNAPVRRLVSSGDEVIGVEFERSGQRLKACARRGVVLTTGGFEYDEQLKKEFLAGYPIYAYGHPGNQGDGIKLAQELGADLWHMKAVAAPMGFKFPEYESAFIMRMPADGYIIVDQNGRRFCNETGLEHYSMWMAVTAFDTDALKFTRLPSYLIFDERTRRSGPITRVGHGSNRGYQWSADSSREIERGWIEKAKDAGELAGRLKLKDSGELAETVAQYNQSCRGGRDERFGREGKTLVELQGDLCGLPLWPCLLNTQGGPRRNGRGQIVNVWGKPIGRLYGAGELGSIWGFLYQSGGNLGECLGWGRMVGVNAASESPHNHQLHT
jgi:succinate dehydrogenase/fumarate reductase flavoprotein subunit